MAKKPTKTTPKRPAGGAEPGPVAAQNVILERMEEQQRVVIEAVTMTCDAARREMGEMKQELSSNIGALETAVRMNSADIKQNSADIKQNSADIKQNSADIRNVAEKLDTRADANRVSALEQRVETLETPVS